MAEVKKENWFKRCGSGIAKYFRELRSELKKVVWPTWSQVMKNALTVVLCVVIVSIFVWAFDVVSKFGVEALLKLGGLLG